MDGPACLEFQRQHGGALPSAGSSESLLQTAQAVCHAKGIDPTCLDTSQIELVSSFSCTRLKEDSIVPYEEHWPRQRRRTSHPLVL